MDRNRNAFLPFCNVECLNRLCLHAVKENATDFIEMQKQADELTNMSASPSFICNAILRDYQIEGVVTMSSWFLRGIGGILADEMGLGKTIQTISFLGNLKKELGITGPHLIIVPLSVLHNWGNEFQRFCPEISFKKLHGSIAERNHLFCEEKVVSGSYDVYLTTYETLIAEEPFFY